MTAARARWDAGDLARRLCRVLDVARQVVERLAADGYADGEQPSNNLRAEKVISETALLLLATASACGGYPPVHARAVQLARQLIPHARSERIRLAVCTQPALALDYAHAHICLTALGHPDQGFDALLRQSTAALAATGHERPPHRALEQCWSEDLWRGPDAPRRRFAGVLLGQSQLAFPLDLLDGQREDVYAFTHALFYCTRFGHHPLRLPRPRRLILAQAEGALARCLDEQDYDLAGELLLAWPLTGKSWSPAATFGFRVLARVEDAAGFLPAPVTRLERLQRLQGSARLDYLLATSYHTTYVMGLLCAAALRPARAPPRTIAAAGARRGNGMAARLLAQRDAEGPSMHWHEQLAQISDAERDAVAGLQLDIALHRARRRDDFAAMHQLLRLAQAAKLSDSPVAGQAAQMLERLATLHELRTSCSLNRHAAGAPPCNPSADARRTPMPVKAGH